jgi:hypothetical protein
MGGNESSSARSSNELEKAAQLAPSSRAGLPSLAINVNLFSKL